MGARSRPPDGDASGHEIPRRPSGSCVGGQCRAFTGNRVPSIASGASPASAGAHAKLGDAGYPGDGYHHAAADGSNQHGHTEGNVPLIPTK